jgi:hypothetical protein
MIVKSRQIGATWYFARERLLVALETGKNQIFLSASRAQANIFRAYIVQWVQKVCGVMLKGDPIVIQRGEGEDGAPLDPVELYFLGTNYRTAQGYHGDVVIDECFWIYGFEELFKVAAAMATHKIYTRTLFSTPSTLAHEAYPMWSGDRFNRRRARRQGADRHGHEALREGALGPTASGARSSPCSTRWRRASTSSMSRNCNANMRSTSSTTCSAACSSTTASRCSPSRSCAAAWSTAGTPGAMSSPMPRSPTRARSGSAMTPMRARTARATMPRWWRSPRPSGRAEIPHPRKEAPQGPPVRPAGRRDPRDGRALSVSRIAIDVTGAGKAVEQIVRKWFPLVTAITYSPLTKSQMVLKAKNVITAGRLEFDAGWMDVMSAFMAIRPEITKHGITYVAGRAGAWAMPTCLGGHARPVLRAARCQRRHRGRSTMEIFDV